MLDAARAICGDFTCSVMIIFVHKCCFHNKYTSKSQNPHFDVCDCPRWRDAGAAAVTNELISLHHVSWI